MIGNFPAVLNFNRLFLKLTGSYVTNCWFSPIIVLHGTITYPVAVKLVGSWNLTESGDGELEKTRMY